MIDRNDFEEVRRVTDLSDFQVGTCFSVGPLQYSYGIYEVLPSDANGCRLRMLITGKEFNWVPQVSSSYRIVERRISGETAIIRKILQMENKRKSLGYRW